MSKLTRCRNVPSCTPNRSRRSFTSSVAKGELKDVVVYIKSITGKPADAAAPPLVMDQKGCEYGPYIAAVQTNQKIVVKNSDPVMHNVHPTPTAAGNEEKNKAQMAGGADIEFTFPAAEKFLRFKCDVHPWMFAYVTVVDNPYFAVSGKDGTLRSPTCPRANTPLKLFTAKPMAVNPFPKKSKSKTAPTRSTSHWKCPNSPFAFQQPLRQVDAVAVCF